MDKATFDGESSEHDYYRLTTTAMSDKSAAFVKRSRAKLRLTQSEFADRLGLERRTIIRYESGGELPIQTRLAIRQLLSVYIRKHRRIQNGNGAE